MKSLLVARKFTCHLIILIFLYVFSFNNPCNAQEPEETYSISLVKTANLDKNNAIHEVDGKKVIAETYTVKDGDHLWQILREKKLLEKKNLVELLTTLKKLNSSLDSIDMIRPGQKIIIPLVISPVGAVASSSPKATLVETIPLEALKDIDLKDYVVKEGDSIIKVVEDLYDIPQKELYSDYLSRLKQMNPFIKDINSVYPGQKIRLPIYSAKVVRVPIKEAIPVPEPMTEAQKEGAKKIADQIGEIFSLMGEQWIQTGEHFFPLKTGGQMKLNAETYPIIDLRSGKKVIVDLYNDLPEKIGSLITSNWDNYGIVHLEGNYNLKDAFDKIVSVCGYKKIYSSGEPFDSTGVIPLTITADRIIEQDGASADKKNLMAINFCDDGSPRTPGVIVDYLALSGIKVIEYPLRKDTSEIALDMVEAKDADAYSLVDALLILTGQKYETDVELPVYQNEKGNLNLVIKADFSIKKNEKEYIIDLSGLGKDIVNLLKEHQYMVLSISNKKSAPDIVSGVFDFLDIKYESKPHQFLSTSTGSKNIALKIQGISFQNSNLKNIFATSLKLPQKLILFLNMKGYRVLQLPATISAAKAEQK